MVVKKVKDPFEIEEIALRIDTNAYAELISTNNKAIEREYREGKIPFYVRERVPNFIDMGRDMYNFRTFEEYVRFRAKHYGGLKNFPGGRYFIREEYIPYETSQKQHSIFFELSEKGKQFSMFVGFIHGKYNLGKCLLLEKGGCFTQKVKA
jgi:hypothetical protein